MSYFEYYDGGAASGYVSIVDPLGRADYDFLSLKEWAEARQTALGGTGNLAVSGLTEVAECRGGGNLIGALAGTTNGLMLETYFTGHGVFPATRLGITIRAASGYECGSVYNIDKCWCHASGSNFCISAQNDDWMYYENIWASGANSSNFRATNSDGGHISGCVSIGKEDGTTSCGIYFTGDEAYIANCVVANIITTGSTNAAFYVGGVSDDQYIYNCTIINCYKGMYITLSTADIYTENCYWDVLEEISNRDTASDWTGHIADYTSTPHHGELPEAQSGVLAIDCFTAPYGPTWDFGHVMGSVLIDVGETLPNVLYDIDGVTRPQNAAYDVGATEYTGIVVDTYPDSYVGGYAWSWQPIGPVYLGAYILARTDNIVSQLYGGYLKAEDGTQVSGYFGGYVFAMDLTAVTGIIGGATSGLNTKTGTIGGYSFGAPDYINYTEAHARTVAKANSEITVDQAFNLDAEVTFKQLDTHEFNSQLSLFRRYAAEFYGKLKVQKYRTPPTIVITSVTPSSGTLLNGARNVVVTASGTLGTGSEFVNCRFDFGDPLSLLQGVSGYNTQGPTWTSNHTYNASGIYAVSVRAADNYGMVGSDVYILNLASGLNPGEHYPYMQITGNPRVGEVPPSLFVTFAVATSGSSLNGRTLRGPYWDFGNREQGYGSTEHTYYNSPGWYAPKAMLQWRHTNPGGDTSVIWVSDTLLIGWNR